MARRLPVLTLVLVLALAGCAAPLAAEEASPPAAPEGAREDAPRNLWLLDAPRPFSTKVSNGAEPLMLAKRDGTLFISDWTGLYRSTDGGATWRATPNPFLELNNVLADGWALAEDADGTLYAADTNGPIVGVAASQDNAETWSLQNKIVEAGAVVDRPWLAARGSGDVVLITNTIRPGFASVQREECVRSRDGGATWTDRAVVNAARPNAGNVVFDSAGNIWFSNGETLFYWVRACQGGPAEIDQPDGGAQIFTQVAIDASDRVYLAQPTDDNGAMRIWSYKRGLGGGTHSVVVSPPELRSNTFGAIDVQGDEIAVAWYGSESAGNPSQGSFSGVWNVYVARLSIPDFLASSTPTIRHDRGEPPRRLLHGRRRLRRRRGPRPPRLLRHRLRPRRRAPRRVRARRREQPRRGPLRSARGLRRRHRDGRRPWGPRPRSRPRVPRGFAAKTTGPEDPRTTRLCAPPWSGSTHERLRSPANAPAASSGRRLSGGAEA